MGASGQRARAAAGIAACCRLAGVLDGNPATRLLDSAQTVRAVRAGARNQHPGTTRTQDIGGRTEQDVDGRPREIHRLIDRQGK